MNLYWCGQNCVKIDSGDCSLAVDPLDLEKELKSAKAASVVVLTHPEGVKIPAKTNSFVINSPGEYDVKGFFVLGWGGFNPSDSLGAGEGVMVYSIEAEGIRLGHVSGVAKEFTDAQLESLSDIDILLIDVGATDETNETASKIVNQIEPRIVVPIGYNPDKKPSIFLKEMGASDVEPQNKLNIKKKDLPQEETKTLLLNVTK